MKLKSIHITAIGSLTIGLMIIAGLFYWYELRPSNIRRECSWVKVIENAKPAQPAITREEAEASQLKYDQCKKDSLQQTGWNKTNGLFACESMLKHEREATFAKPESEGYREATEKEYDKCLHQKGLK